MAALQAIACSGGSDVSGHPCVAALHALRLLACGVVAVASSAEAVGPVGSDSEALMQDVFSTVFECLRAGHQAFLGREAVKPKAKSAVSEQVCVVCCVVLCCVVFCCVVLWVCFRRGGVVSMVSVQNIWRCVAVVHARVFVADFTGPCTFVCPSSSACRVLVVVAQLIVL